MKPLIATVAVMASVALGTPADAYAPPPMEIAAPAVATAQARRLGNPSVWALLEELYPPELLDHNVVIAYADLGIYGGIVPWGNTRPECLPATRTGDCIVLHSNWPRYSIDHQRIIIAHEWAHVLTEPLGFDAFLDECLADAIARNVITAKGYRWRDNYECPEDHSDDAAAVLAGRTRDS